MQPHAGSANGKLVRVKSLSLAVLGVTAAIALPASAATATRLDYARSASAVRCPDEVALRRLVALRLGYDAFFPVASQTIAAEIVDEGSHLHARVRLIDDRGIIRGTRHLYSNGRDCAELGASLALAISIVLDPLAVALGPAPVVAAPEAPQAKPVPPRTTSFAPEPTALATDPAPIARALPPDRAVVPTVTPSASRAIVDRAYAGAGAALVLGALPQASPSAFLRLGVQGQHWSVAVDGRGSLSTQSSAQAVGYLQATLLTASLATCWRSGPLSVCALGIAGSSAAMGRTARGATPTYHGFYAAAGLRTELSQELRAPVRWLASVEFTRSLTPTAYQLGGEEIWRLPDWGGLLAFGALVDFL